MCTKPTKQTKVKYMLRGVSKRFRLEERRVDPQNVAGTVQRQTDHRIFRRQGEKRREAASRSLLTTSTVAYTLIHFLAYSHSPPRVSKL
jgi:hypothetical protein